MTNYKIERTIEDLFNEYFHSLVFSSFRLIKDYALAEDIVQNVFVKVWQDYDKLRHISNMKSYLNTAVRNSSLNYLRDQKPVLADDSFFESLVEEEQTDSDMERNEDDLENKIHKAVDNLPEKWKEAFILSKYNNLKYYEIAKKMKISDKTVEKYISKALSLLRVELKHLLSIMTLFIMNKL
jgi:RNA polymerase sigma-70 factor, ECF subfamily